jgi:ketosteroid isomerase-like protein
MSRDGDALAIVRAYHDAWTAGNHDAAGRCLAEDLVVEVPINSYPTRASFVAALAAFAPLVRHVAVLSSLGGAGEAMLLYDMEVEQLGRLRVAEHFSVSDGQIHRLRQVHDTAAVRAAGFGS